MAGYFRKLDGHVYEGGYKAKEELPNGVFAHLEGTNGDEVALGGHSVKCDVVEKTSLWGLPAIVLRCTVADGKIFFIENEFEDYGDKGDFNVAEYTVPVGHYVKMRCPAVNDEMIMTVPQEKWDSLAVGNAVVATANGYVDIDD